MLGLELQSPSSDAELKSMLEDPDWYRETIFTINDKFFTVDSYHQKGITVEEIWEEAATKIVDKLVRYITLEGFRDEAY